MFGLGLSFFLLDVINPLFAENRLPQLRFRIGIDCGSVHILVLGAVKIKTVRDLLGYTVNIAAKICQIAEPNSIQIGESVYRNIHVTRKKEFKKLDPLPPNWNYQDDSEKRVYGMYVSPV